MGTSPDSFLALKRGQSNGFFLKKFIKISFPVLIDPGTTMQTRKNVKERKEKL
jgi:hypothetical protein